MAATISVASTIRPRDGNFLRTTAAAPTLISSPFSIMLGTTPLRERRMERPGNGKLLPVIRAESSQAAVDYVPEARFYKVEAIIRPWRVRHVSSGLLKMGIRGVTISDVKGFGAQGGSTERHAGSEFSEDKFVSKTKLEIVVSKDQVEAVIEKIIDEARTGEIGDGKIFVMPVSDLIRVRTGERGEKAEKMTGGRSDMVSTLSSDIHTDSVRK